MKGYRLTTLGKIVLFSLLFLIVLSTAYTVKAFKYKKGNANIPGNASAYIIPTAKNNTPNISKETNSPYDYKSALLAELGINKLSDAKLTIYFESDGDSLKEQYSDALDMLAKVADVLKDYMIKVEGNCATVYTSVPDNKDNVVSYNLSLSRAESVSSYLQKKGIDAKRIITVGNGSNKPFKSNLTEEDRMYNRRVEITFVLNK